MSKSSAAYPQLARYEKRSRLASKERFEFGNQCGLWCGSDGLVHDFAVFEKQDGWNRVDPVTRGEILTIVDVDLCHLGLAGLGRADFVYHGAQHAAWTAPWGPEIDKDGYRGVDDFGLKI